jgi:hypothetical protein
MSKLLSLLIATTFATASVGAFAMSHGGAPKDGAKMEEKKMDCSKEKMEKMDDKMKAECKKMESKAEPKK